MGAIDEFKRGLAGEEMSGCSKYSIAGVAVRCGHCGGERFERRKALLNTRGMTLIHLDWANRQATVLVCANCTHISWFLEEPERI